MSLRSWLGDILGIGGATSEKVEGEMSFEVYCRKVRTLGLYRCGAAVSRRTGKRLQGCGQEKEIDGKRYCGYPGSHCRQKYYIKESDGSLTVYDEQPWEEGWEGVYEWSEVEIRQGKRKDINGSIQ